MTQQLIDFTAPHNHSDTSRAAAGSIVPVAGELRSRVLAFIRERGEYGATDFEIASGLGMLSQTAIPRRSELWKAGLTVDSGVRRATQSGRTAKVWRAV